MVGVEAVRRRGLGMEVVAGGNGGRGGTRVRVPEGAWPFINERGGEEGLKMLGLAARGRSVARAGGVSTASSRPCRLSGILCRVAAGQGGQSATSLRLYGRLKSLSVPIPVASLHPLLPSISSPRPPTRRSPSTPRPMLPPQHRPNLTTMVYRRKLQPQQPSSFEHHHPPSVGPASPGSLAAQAMRASLCLHAAAISPASKSPPAAVPDALATSCCKTPRALNSSAGSCAAPPSPHPPRGLIFFPHHGLVSTPRTTPGSLPARRATDLILIASAAACPHAISLRLYGRLKSLSVPIPFTSLHPLLPSISSPRPPTRRSPSTPRPMSPPQHRPNLTTMVYRRKLQPQQPSSFEHHHPPSVGPAFPGSLAAQAMHASLCLHTAAISPTSKSPVALLGSRPLAQPHPDRRAPLSSAPQCRSSPFGFLPWNRAPPPKRLLYSKCR
ncbi:vegetative cell wall protein gp1-like [Panicum hallii]|uniref:vegetative cell wall protein gp1-like n=1 Tax=Panicum hallii TaxID=206008 RepID=UPI000DF4E584|nr:vegetative cell wall protein gp1-like [Panicum hallii]